MALHLWQIVLLRCFVSIATSRQDIDSIKGNGILEIVGSDIVNVNQREASDSQSPSSTGSCCLEDVDEFLTEATGGGQAGSLTKFALAFGTGQGACCVIERGYSRNQAMHVYSASKWITGYIMLSLIEANLFQLDTRASEIFDWWTNDPEDVRSLVTVRHLMSQTSGMDTFGGGWKGLGKFKGTTTEACAQEAYDKCFRERLVPGTAFRYTEATFMVLGAIAIHVTGISTFNGVFRKYIGDPLGMSSASKFEWDWLHWGMGKLEGSGGAIDPGDSLQTTVDDYSKFLTAVFNKQIVPESLVAQAESPQTVGAVNKGALTAAGLENGAAMPTTDVAITVPLAVGSKFHYGLAEWIECITDDCNPVMRVSSLGSGGSYPWLERRGGNQRAPHWGFLIRWDLPNITNHEALSTDVRVQVGNDLALRIAFAVKQGASR